MNISVVENVKGSYFDDLLDLYKQEDWTSYRKPEEIKAMLDHCMVIGLVDMDLNKLVGLARIVTDSVFRATIYDVIILAQYQGKGLGRLLLENVVNHPKIKGTERVDLYCEDNKVEFYEKWGFRRINGVTNFMRKTAGGL